MSEEYVVVLVSTIVSSIFTVLLIPSLTSLIADTTLSLLSVFKDVKLPTLVLKSSFVSYLSGSIPSSLVKSSLDIKPSLSIVAFGTFALEPIPSQEVPLYI